LWLCLAGFAWLAFFRRMPVSLQDWLWLLFLGLPAFLLASLVGELIGNAFHSLPGIRQAERYAESRARDAQFSILRVGVYLITTLLSLALLAGIVWFARIAMS
jgi:hypothetical protein